jgi:hypothetical protein
MRVADLHTGAARLHEALELLEDAWGAAKVHWDDGTSQNFQENHLDPIVPKIRATLDAVNRLAEVLARAQRECEE